jgi:cation transport ATPase
MGGGTDIAIESADIIILSNRLSALPMARQISSRSYRKMVQNVTLAFIFNQLSWLECLSGGRQQKLQAEIAKARKEDASVDLLLFTQFADKATILRKAPNVIRGDRNLNID